MHELKMQAISEFEQNNYPLGEIFKEKLMRSSLLTLQGKLRSMELMPAVTTFGGN